jgi:DNA-binding NtrC family response regulator
MERAVLLADGPIIRPGQLPLEKMGRMLPSRTTGLRAIPAPLATAGDEADERARIVAALEQCGGNQSIAADLLGMSRSTLVRRLEEYTLPRPRKGARPPAPKAS